MRIRPRTRAALALAAALAAASPPATAGPILTAQEIFGAHNLYGVNRVNGHLFKYNFTDAVLTDVGPVVDSDGIALTGVNGSAYIPGFQQIHVFWTDPADSQTHMFLTDVETGYASLDVLNLGTGLVTGAVGHTFTEPSSVNGIGDITRFKLYALQTAIGLGDGLAGNINLNPNNAVGEMDFFMRYYVTAPDGTVTGPHEVTHSDLHNLTSVNADGVVIHNGVLLDEENVYAEYVRVRPKGNGDQNGLIVSDGSGTWTLSLQNSEVYEFEATNIKIRVQNSRVRGARPIGDWWIDVTAREGTLTGGDGTVINFMPAPASKLVRIDTQTRDIDDIWTLSRVYNCLATEDAETFYAASGSQLYKIDVATGAETLVGSIASPMNLGLEFVNGRLVVFETYNNKLIPIDALTGAAIAYPMDLGVTHLGTIIFATDLELGKYD